MTPDELRRARSSLGLSVRQFAAMLAVDPDLVRRMEIQTGSEGHRPIPNPTRRLVRAYLDGYRPADWPTGHDDDGCEIRPAGSKSHHAQRRGNEDDTVIDSI